METERRTGVGGKLENGGNPNGFKFHNCSIFLKRINWSAIILLLLVSSNHIPSPVSSFPITTTANTRRNTRIERLRSSYIHHPPRIQGTRSQSSFFPRKSPSNTKSRTSSARYFHSHFAVSCSHNHRNHYHRTNTRRMGRWNMNSSTTCKASNASTNSHALMSPFLFGNCKNFKIYPRSHFVDSFTSTSSTRCYASPSNDVLLGDNHDNSNNDDENLEGDDDYQNKYQMATGLIHDDSTTKLHQSSFDSPDMHYDTQQQQQPLTEISVDPNNNNSTLSSLPPLPKFLIDDEDDDEESNHPSKSNESETTKLQIEQQQKQIDLLMEMVKSQQLQVQQQLQLQQQQQQQQIMTTNMPNTISPSSASTSSVRMMDNSLQEESDIADEDAIYLQQNLSSNTSDNASTTTTTIVTPLKAMLFIDGTWLYYSLHHRREDDCPIIRKLGKGWQHKYKFDWAALPRIICEQMQKQQTNQGWSSNVAMLDFPTTESSSNHQTPTIQRPVEIVRASVFTSYKKTTDPQSIRVRMYEEMAAANYDVHMMETVGKGEKCVDIQLAVEMLHYATVPDAYDVAILLSGDKDFIPAMVRTRQKGRKVGVVSMRTGCNKALYEGTRVKDFDVVWIEDFLDQLFVPMTAEELNSHRRGTTQPYGNESNVVSHYTMIKVIYDFVQNSPSGRVSSRDIGRYLKSLTIGQINMLDDLKLNFGGLKQFLVERVPFIFTVINRDWDEIRDARDRTFWVEVNENSMEALLKEAKETEFSDDEKTFWSNYESSDLNSSESQAYYHTEEIIASSDNVGTNKNENYHHETTKAFTIPPELKKDYSKSTVVQLKEICRERKLPVSGTKAVLLERIETDIEKKIKSLYEKFTSQKKESISSNQQQQNQRIRADMTRSKMGSRLISKPNNGSGMGPNPSTVNSSSRYTPTNNMNRHQDHVNPAITQHLEELVTEYLKASGGQAGSRDVGRYLAANRVSGVTSSNGQKRMTALQELKDNYGSLANFIGSRSDVFVRVRETTPSKQDDYGFPIMLNR